MSDFTARHVKAAGLPVIDVARLASPVAADRIDEAHALGEACRTRGFFYVSNHGVAQPVIDELFRQARLFFDLDPALKQALDVRHSPALRGYTPLLAENTDPKGRGDLHEAFDIGGVLFDGSPGAGFNRYPESLPGLRPAMEAYVESMLALSRTLMSGFAQALHLPADHFAGLITDPQMFLRVLHYPPQSGVIDETQIGIGAHTDYECFTILAQDDNAALQVADGQGGWIWATALPGAFVVNIGDQMARWTNGRFTSTLHRVINRTGNRRYSIPFFFGPNPDAMIEALPGCHDAGNPPRDAPIRAGDYSRQRFEESYRQAGETTAVQPVTRSS